MNNNESRTMSVVTMTMLIISIVLTVINLLAFKNGIVIIKDAEIHIDNR